MVGRGEVGGPRPKFLPTEPVKLSLQVVRVRATSSRASLSGGKHDIVVNPPAVLAKHDMVNKAPGPSSPRPFLRRIKLYLSKDIRLKCPL